MKLGVSVTITAGRWTHSWEVRGFSAIGYVVLFLGLWSASC